MTEYTASTHSVTAALLLTPSDTQDATTLIKSKTAAAHPFARGIMVTADGDVACVLSGGDTITLPGLIAGQVYPFQVSYLLSTGTTATGVIALF